MVPLFVLITLFLGVALGQDPQRPYPLPDAFLKSTNVLDHASYVKGLDDPQWYLDNIPFVDFPDKHIQDVYYYRASVIKRHLKFGHEGQGWLFTEFIHPVAWASKLQTIPDSVGHHVVEGRWLRDPNYVKDLIELYTRGGVEALSGITYTHYFHDAVLEHAQATGDVDFLTAQLDGMIRSFDLWNVTINETIGLYHRIPLSDAQEFSLPGYVVGGVDGKPVDVWNDTRNDYDLIWLGPETYRPNFNAYMIAGARAISEIASLLGNTALSEQWAARASGIEDRMTSFLWDNDLQFWIDIVEGSNIRVEGRELIGYFPYRFDVGTNETYVKALEAGLTPDEFITQYGPTTLEQTNPYYTALKNLTYCCIWQGQSWPFSTSVFLDVLADLARNNRSSVATKEFFNAAFLNYTLTNYKDGIPYTAESHYPTIDMWSGDTGNHSEHYLHSTYFNNVFGDLIGIIPTLEDRLQMHALVPDSWSYFAVENLPYHGSLLTILWDADGSHYKTSNSSSGLSIWSNGTLIHTQSTLAPVNITFGSKDSIAYLASRPSYQNILANPNSPWGYPRMTADYFLSLNGDISPYEAWKMNDGLLWYDTEPDNRWTNNQSHTPYNQVGVVLPRARNFGSISIAIMDDSERGGVIKCPSSIHIYTNNGTLLAERSPWTSCKGNALNTIVFDAAGASNDSAGTIGGMMSANGSASAEGTIVETDNLQIMLFNQIEYAVAVPEIQIWVPENTGPRYEAEDGLLGTFVGGFEGRALGLNCTIEDGGVSIHQGGWAELAGVKSTVGKGSGTLTVIGKGTGSVAVQMNWLEGNVTVAFDSDTVVEKDITVDFQEGENYVTMLWASGDPWVDAIIVGGGSANSTTRRL